MFMSGGKTHTLRLRCDQNVRSSDWMFCGTSTTSDHYLFWWLQNSFSNHTFKNESALEKCECSEIRGILFHRQAHKFIFSESGFIVFERIFDVSDSYYVAEHE